MLVTRPGAILALAAVAGACTGGETDESAPSARAEEPHPRVEMLGVDPADFECHSIASEEGVAAIVGGDVRLARSQFEPPRGVTRPCIYTLARYAADAGADPSRWSIDYDCRNSAIGDGERLMAQYATDDGAKPVRVGRSGIDREPALLFIDDDAPCHVRIVGPSRDLRIGIATLVSGELTGKNAPMTPVYRHASE